MSARQRQRLRRTLVVYLAAVGLTLAALAALTVHVVRGEHAQHRAEALATHHEDLRLALYRMESRLAPLIARALAQAEGQLQLAPRGDEPGPDSSELDQNFLLNAETGSNDLVHPWDEELGQVLRLAAWGALEQEDLAGGRTDPAAVRAPAEPSAPRQAQLVAEGDVGTWIARGDDRSQREFTNRKANATDNLAFNGVAPVQTLQVAGGGLDPLPLTRFHAGPLVARWQPDEEPEVLLLARAVRAGEHDATQVFGLPWPELERTLSAELVDLLPGARLLPVDPLVEPEVGADHSMHLAAVPVRLEVDPPELRPRLAPRTRGVLLGTWALALVALLAVGSALRSGLAHGERHRRFTSAVTHELRTPLTTFRLYSEMLARGMVPEDSRQEYLHTLEQESGRLAALVENVLRYARLEEGHATPRWVELTASELLRAPRADLERRLAAAGLTLEIPEPLPDLRVRTDPEAVAAILGNLVDNAAKYGRGPTRRVRLAASQGPRGLRLLLSDDRPGVPARHRPRLFEPFERCGRDERDPAPGVGLGLALAREQARALGGDLRLVEGDGPGASFELTLPRA